MEAGCAGGSSAGSAGELWSQQGVRGEEGRAERGGELEGGGGGGAATVGEEDQRQETCEGGAGSSQMTGGKQKRKRRVREVAETVEDALLPVKNSE